MANNTVATTAQYGTVVTAIGAAKIAACILNGTKINITHAAVGDGGGAYYKPTVEQSALVKECWRGEIAFAKISESDSNMIDVKFIVPAEVGGFTIREAALIDAEGDTIAICNTPDAQKITITDGVSFPLTMIMHIIVTDASVVSFSINPALDTVSRETMETALAEAIKAHNEDPDAHTGLLKFVIGDTQPESGPTLWFDTSGVPSEPTPVLYLDLGPLNGAEVTAEIEGETYDVDNIGVNTTPTEGNYSLDITE